MLENAGGIIQIAKCVSLFINACINLSHYMAKPTQVP